MIVIHKNRIPMTCVLLLWFYTAYISLAAAFSNMMGTGRTYSDGILYLALDLPCLIYIFLTPSRKYPRIALSCGLLLCCQLFGMFIAGMSGLGILIMRTSFWVIGLIALYKYLSRNPDATAFFIELYSLGLAALMAYVAWQSSSVRDQIEAAGGMNELYIALLGLPLVMLARRKLIRLIGIGITVIAVLFSLKLTALLVLVLGLVVYAVLTSFVKKGKLNTRLLALLVAVILIWAFLPAINDFLLRRFRVDWLDKIVTADETGGSGRTEIWRFVFQALGKSNPLQLFVGHGYYATFRNVGFSAHNDFLEVLYDFGLFGFSVYISIYILLIRRTLLLLRKADPRGPVLGMSIAMVFILSMFSHMVITPHLFINCALIWAVCFVNRQNAPLPKKGFTTDV